MVELVDTLVLEASTSVCEFESRLGHQIDAVYGSGHPLGLISQESLVRIQPPQPNYGNVAESGLLQQS